MIERAPLSNNEIPVFEQAFPGGMLEDDWIVYHGTSNIYEGLIDYNGLRSGSSAGLNDTLLFKEIYFDYLSGIIPPINITGISGGFDILVPYFFGEIEKFKTRPVSLGFTWERCEKYSTVDFAGGELFRGVTRAYESLEVMLNDERAQEEWEEQRKREEETSFIPKKELNLEELKIKVGQVKCMYEEVQKLRRRWNYGVIYAIDLRNVDKVLLRKEAQGLYCLGEIPKECIAGKMIVREPRDNDRTDSEIHFNRTLIWRERLKASSSKMREAFNW